MSCLFPSVPAEWLETQGSRVWNKAGQVRTESSSTWEAPTWVVRKREVPVWVQGSEDKFCGRASTWVGPWGTVEVCKRRGGRRTLQGGDGKKLDSTRDRPVQDAETRSLASLESQAILINLEGKCFLISMSPNYAGIYLLWDELWLSHHKTFLVNRPNSLFLSILNKTMAITNLWNKDWQEHMQRQPNLTGSEAKVSANMKKIGPESRLWCPLGYKT